MTYYDIHTHQPRHTPGIQEIENILLQYGAPAPPIQAGRYYSVGIHPRHIPHTPQHRQQLLHQLAETLQHPRIVAIGECGIDKRSHTPPHIQQQLFAAQITLSETHRKPLIIHCVKAWQEIVQLRRHLHPRQPWIIHGFRGKPQLAGMLLQHELWLSVGPHIPPTLSRAVPLDHLLPETDDTPQPVTTVYEHIARIWHTPLSVVQAQIQKNMQQLFPAVARR